VLSLPGAPQSRGLAAIRGTRGASQGWFSPWLVWPAEPPWYHWSQIEQPGDATIQVGLAERLTLGEVQTLVPRPALGDRYGSARSVPSFGPAGASPYCQFMPGGALGVCLSIRFHHNKLRCKDYERHSAFRFAQALRAESQRDSGRPRLTRESAQIRQAEGRSLVFHPYKCVRVLVRNSWDRKTLCSTPNPGALAERQGVSERAPNSVPFLRRSDGHWQVMLSPGAVVRFCHLTNQNPEYPCGHRFLTCLCGYLIRGAGWSSARS